MKTKCLIIDDEPLAINVIKNHLKEFNDIELVSTFTNAIDALTFLKDNTVDLIFLDINMPLLDGLNFIKSLEKKPLIIITTAHIEYAVESFELDVLDYLVKPIPFPRFVKAVNKFFKNLNTQQVNKSQTEKPYFFIKIDKKKMKKIYLDEILVIESLKDYLKITTESNRFIIHQTLSSFTEQLPEDNFIRIHRSYTIAIDKIDTIEGNSVEIAGVRYPFGRTYIEEVKNKILNL
ncbi:MULTISPECIES: LytR/AlgR family response regulator transcription factor [Flavobacteriaceae]|uniref:Response regulator transcription factor n=2 Tax=Flavobacteriaceae TaxID=49546 RepID=A0A4Y8AQN2_9FLAO|nr:MULTISPECIES: response regulator transcription factor [Flavobacteriaceae]TEW73051.1 response regulator transcription factor [Gramella jeungdoensis]GGK47440.1 DNA-binding response regulator [Lutibacter litoralis]